MEVYLALLRGINVGGNAVIKMTDLKSCFEKSGFNDVRTYIQSGNVLFKTDADEKSVLTGKIEKALSDRFGYSVKVVLKSIADMQNIVNEAPKEFGKYKDLFRYDVYFLFDSLRSEEVIRQFSLKPGVDEAFTGKDVLYCSRLISKASQSRLNKVISLPVYKNITIRNWNTTTKLLELMSK